MLLKLTAAAVLGLALLTPQVGAQTLAEQMQKAAFTQDTEGDYDAAIGIYRQILASAQTPREVAATAQFRLVQTLMQKGDLEAALQEFHTLVQKHGDHRELIAAMAKRLEPSLNLPALGAAGNRKYRNPATGVELTAPLGAKLAAAGPSSDNGEMATFHSPWVTFMVWMRPERHSPAELAALVQDDMAIKPRDREGFQDWKLRPGVTTGGGPDRQWLSATADYIENGHRMVEQLRWYRTTKMHVLFIARMVEEEILRNQLLFDQLVSSAVIP